MANLLPGPDRVARAAGIILSVPRKWEESDCLTCTVMEASWEGSCVALARVWASISRVLLLNRWNTLVGDTTIWPLHPGQVSAPEVLMISIIQGWIMGFRIQNLTYKIPECTRDAGHYQGR